MTQEYIPTTEDLISAIDRLTVADPDDIRQMKISLVKNFIEKTSTIQSDLANYTASIMPNAHMYDQSMLKLGKIIDDCLIVDLVVLTIKINLSGLISECLQHNNVQPLLDMLDHGFDLYKFQPLVMVMCVQTEQFDLLDRLIDLATPIDAMNYRSIYHLASKGKLSLLQKIMSKYQFVNPTEIAGKICVEAIRENHVDILRYFCPAKLYESAPDIMQMYMYNSIQYGGHLDIVKHFIDMGCPIQLDSWRAVKVAIQNNRGSILKLFSEICPEVLSIIPVDVQKRFGLIVCQTKNKRIENKNCSIYYSDINLGDLYYQCNFSSAHFFCKEAWESWLKKRSDWLCPVCRNTVDTILYKNVDDI